MALLFRMYVRVDTGRESLLDRYRDDIVNRDAEIESQRRSMTKLNEEIIRLRIALDACQDR
jgi:hypothetical protein